MMTFRACRPEHVHAVDVQPEQQGDKEFLLTIGPETVVRGMSFSAWTGETCVAAGGVFPQWPGHGFAWILIAPAAAPEMLCLTRFSRQLFDTQPYRRLTTYVRCDFAAGQRWAKLLGFELECERMKAYDPLGRDCAQYVRLKD